MFINALEACPVNKTQQRSLEFTLKRVLMKVFQITSVDVITEIAHRPSVRTVSDGCLKRICSLDTSVFSVLKVLTTTAPYKCTYLLTYLQNVDIGLA